MSDTTSREQEHLERIRPRLAPELEVLRPLGHGSVARVYLAREPALQRLVAVKVLRDDVATDAIALQRFDREAQAVARITHPNVTAIYRVGRAGRLPYIVMEHVDGRTLADILASRGPMPSDEVRRVLSATSDALAAAHRKGIVHRHVRPVNVMVEEDTGRVVLMDFGMAALLETASQQVAQLTAAGVRVGDPLRMSPEQQRGEPVGPPADVYCLGLLGYELLMGGMPRFGVQYVESEGGMTVRPIEEVRPDVDPALAALIGRCLASRPEARPRAADVAEALSDRARAVATVAASGGARDRENLTAIPGLRAFLEEIGRRKTGRVAIAYIVIAFLLLEVTGRLVAILPGGEGGPWHRAITVLIAAGFPVALVLSWLFDVTEKGIRRQAEVDAETLVVQPAARLRWLPLLGLAVSVLAFTVLWWVLGRRFGWF